MKIPRVIISANNSDAGKTIITSAILRILKNKGYRVQPFKIGPDYIDPMYLTKASGRACRNIDSWIMSKDMILYNLIKSYENTDFIIIEGVRGLYEGSSPIRDIGSTAHIAKISSTPIILVMNCRGLTKSIAAQIIGFKSLDKKLRISGVILNNVKDKIHEEKIRRAINYYTNIPIIGVLYYSPLLNIKKRHLGLITPNEIREINDVIENASKLLEPNLDIDKLIEIMNSSPEIHSNFEFNFLNNEKIKIGVLMDCVFSFYYYENLEILRKMNTELIFINSLSDNYISDEISGILIGGGYPEVFAEELEKNQSLYSSIKKKALDEMPIIGECGGLMYLCKSINYNERKYKMIGIFDGDVYFSDKVVVSYVKLETKINNIISKEGDIIKGHEFHYSYIENISSDFVFYVKRGKGIKNKMDGAFIHKTLGMYTHLHYLSCPNVPKNFIIHCKNYIHK